MFVNTSLSADLSSFSHYKSTIHHKRHPYEDEDEHENYDHCMGYDDDDDDEDEGMRGYACYGRGIGFHPDISQLHVRW